MIRLERFGVTVALVAAVGVAVMLVMFGCSASPTVEPQRSALPTVTPTAVVVEPEASAAVDAEAFIAALSDDLRAVQALEVPEVREFLIRRGEAVCEAYGAGSGYEDVLISAERMFSDRSVYAPTMPGAFVAAAEEHLCGGVQ